MKLKKLEEYLQDVEPFEEPKVELEQYTTPASIAATMLYTIESRFGDIEDKLVADVGCGAGMLSVGCLLLGAAGCTGFEIDPEALKVCAQNMAEFELGFEAVLGDTTMPMSRDCFYDTAVLNPPFGTHRKGVDVSLVAAAIQMTRQAVYSLHKTSTRDYVLRKANEWKVKSEVVAEIRFDLPKTYRFHKKQSVDIKVDLVRFWDLHRD